MPPHPANFVFLVEMRFLHVGHVGLELPTSGDLPPTSSQSAGITGVSHCTWLSLSKRKKVCGKLTWTGPGSKAGLGPALLSGSHGPRSPTTVPWPPPSTQWAMLSLFFFDTEFCSCYPGWSAVAQSWLTATFTSQVLLHSWDYRRAPPRPANFVFSVEMGFLHFD